MFSDNSISQTLNSFISDITNISTQNIQNCANIATQSQSVDVGVVHGDANLSGLTFEQSSSQNVQCSADTTTDNDIQTTIAQKASQTAEQVTQALSFRVGSSSDVNNTVNMLTQTATVINNVSEQDCKNNVLQQQNIHFGEVDGNFSLTNSNFKQVNDQMADCLQKSQTSNKVIQNLSSVADQYAKMEEKGVFDFLSSIIIAVMIIIGMIIFACIYFLKSGASGIGSIFSGSFFIGVISTGLFGTGIYFIVGYYRYWNPYKAPAVDQATGQTAALSDDDASKNRNYIIMGSIFTALGAIGIAYVLYKAKQTVSEKEKQNSENNNEQQQ